MKLWESAPSDYLGTGMVYQSFADGVYAEHTTPEWLVPYSAMSRQCPAYADADTLSRAGTCNEMLQPQYAAWYS